MSGLFKRLSSRRSGGPEGTEPPAAAEPGTTVTDDTVASYLAALTRLLPRHSAAS